MLARADLVLAIQPEEQEQLERLCDPPQRVITAGVDFPVLPASHPATEAHSVIYRLR